MASSRKEKHYANTRSRRSSKSKKDKDTDTESVTSSTHSSADTAIAEPKCPLRFMLAGMMDSNESDGKKKGVCPLRRVQLWHVIPLCLLAILNLLLVIIALLGLAAYRITMGVQTFIFSLAKAELNDDPYMESIADTDATTAAIPQHIGNLI